MSESKQKIRRQDLIDKILDESPDNMGALIVSVDKKGNSQIQLGLSDGTADEQILAMANIIKALKEAHKNMADKAKNHVKIRKYH